jgi:hypothetical protein
MRMARKDNLGSKTKEHEGGFVDGGATVNRCDGDPCLVKDESGKLIKRRHYDSKGLGGLILVRLRLEGDAIEGDIRG